MMLETFGGAVRDFEGAPGDRNYRNNNPGNCKYYSGGYLPMYGNVQRDAAGFAIFPTYQLGWTYLLNLIHHHVLMHPDWTIFEFFAGRVQTNGLRAGGYAPSTDNNNPTRYAAFVAARCGVSMYTTLAQLFAANSG